MLKNCISLKEKKTSGNEIITMNQFFQHQFRHVDISIFAYYSCLTIPKIANEVCYLQTVWTEAEAAWCALFFCLFIILMKLTHVCTNQI